MLPDMTQNRKKYFVIRGKNQSYCTNGCEMFSSSFVRQAKRTKELIYFVLCFAMFSSQVVAYPNPNNKPRFDKIGNSTMVIFPACRPVNTHDLMKRMGGRFDDSRMALDEDGVRKAMLRERATEDDEDEDDFQNDGVLSETDSVTGIGAFDSDIDKLSTSRRNSSRRGRPKRNKIQIHKWTDDPRDPNYLESMKFMRKKRSVDEDSDLYNEYEGDSDVTLYQQIMQLKVKHRRFKRAKKLKSRNKFPWTCKMKKTWLRMKEGYFPEFIRSARCRSKKCYYNTLECIPKKYTIHVLRRDPNRCNPVPTVGLTSTYEEAWVFERQHVTVWCECGNPRNKKRRKNRGRSRSRP